MAMDILQLSLIVVALVSCSLDSELDECLEDEGFSLILQVRLYIYQCVIR